MPSDGPLDLGEGDMLILCQHDVGDLVMESQEACLQLGDDHVLIVPGIADDRSPGAAGWIVAREAAGALVLIVACQLGPENEMDPIAFIQVGLVIRSPAI